MKKLLIAGLVLSFALLGFGCHGGMTPENLTIGTIGEEAAPSIETTAPTIKPPLNEETPVEIGSIDDPAKDNDPEFVYVPELMPSTEVIMSGYQIWKDRQTASDAAAFDAARKIIMDVSKGFYDGVANIIQQGIDNADEELGKSLAIMKDYQDKNTNRFYKLIDKKLLLAMYLHNVGYSLHNIDLQGTLRFWASDEKKYPYASILTREECKDIDVPMCGDCRDFFLTCGINGLLRASFDAWFPQGAAIEIERKKDTVRESINDFMITSIESSKQLLSAKPAFMSALYEVINQPMDAKEMLNFKGWDKNLIAKWEDSGVTMNDAVVANLDFISPYACLNELHDSYLPSQKSYRWDVRLQYIAMKMALGHYNERIKKKDFTTDERKAKIIELAVNEFLYQYDKLPPKEQDVDIRCLRDRSVYDYMKDDILPESKVMLDSTAKLATKMAVDDQKVDPENRKTLSDLFLADFGQYLTDVFFPKVYDKMLVGDIVVTSDGAAEKEVIVMPDGTYKTKVDMGERLPAYDETFKGKAE